MLREVIVGTAVDTLDLLEAERHLELDICSCVGVESKLLVVVETIVLIAHAECLVPSQAGLLPIFEPVHLRAGLAEELHLHLLEFAHTEDKLTGNDLVAESLTNLSNTKRQLLTRRALHIKEVDKDTLCGLRTEIDLVRSAGCGTDFGREHQVELTHVSPVLCAANRINDTLVEDDLLQLLEIRTLHSSGVTGMEGIALLLMFKDAGVGLAELLLIESVTKLLGGFLYLLINFLIVFGNLILDEVISTIALLRVAVVDERIIESIHVTAGLPYGRVHEDGGINTDDVVVEQHH